MPSRNSIDNERAPIGFPNLLNGADVWMIERGRNPGLALETAEGLRVFCDDAVMRNNLADELGCTRVTK